MGSSSNAAARFGTQLIASIGNYFVENNYEKSHSALTKEAFKNHQIDVDDPNSNIVKEIERVYCEALAEEFGPHPRVVKSLILSLRWQPSSQIVEYRNTTYQEAWAVHGLWSELTNAQSEKIKKRSGKPKRVKLSSKQKQRVRDGLAKEEDIKAAIEANRKKQLTGITSSSAPTAPIAPTAPAPEGKPLYYVDKSISDALTMYKDLYATNIWRDRDGVRFLHEWNKHGVYIKTSYLDYLNTTTELGKKFVPLVADGLSLNDIVPGRSYTPLQIGRAMKSFLGKSVKIVENCGLVFEMHLHLDLDYNLISFQQRNGEEEAENGEEEAEVVVSAEKKGGIPVHENTLLNFPALVSRRR